MKRREEKRRIRGPKLQLDEASGAIKGRRLFPPTDGSRSVIVVPVNPSQTREFLPSLNLYRRRASLSWSCAATHIYCGCPFVNAVHFRGSMSMRCSIGYSGYRWRLARAYGMWLTALRHSLVNMDCALHQGSVKGVMRIKATVPTASKDAGMNQNGRPAGVGRGGQRKSGRCGLFVPIGGPLQGRVITINLCVFHLYVFPDQHCSEIMHRGRKRAGGGLPCGRASPAAGRRLDSQAAGEWVLA